MSGPVEDYRPPPPPDDEGPSPEDLERFDDPTILCPECGCTLYDDVEVCWNCGQALDGRRTGKPPAWVLAVVVVLVAVMIWGYVAGWF